MILLNEHEIAWFNHNRQDLDVPDGSSPAAWIYVRKGVNGVARLHEAIMRRDIEKIQALLDS